MPRSRSQSLCGRVAIALGGAALLFCGLSLPNTAEAALSVSFVFQRHHKNLTYRQKRRLRRYRRSGCRVFSLSKSQQRFSLRSLSHAFGAMNDKKFRRIIRRKRFTYTSLSGRSILRKIQMKHRSLPVFGYVAGRGCPVSHTATAFAIYGMIFLRASYLNRVIRTRNWRRLAQTLAHEWMHGVGFGHGRNSGQGSAQKRNSVPIFIGCLVKYAPRLKFGQRMCSRGKYGRRPRLARRYPKNRRNRRYRRPQVPFHPRYKQGGDWLSGPSRAPRGRRARPFLAPAPPKQPSKDWLDAE